MLNMYWSLTTREPSTISSTKLNSWWDAERWGSNPPAPWVWNLKLYQQRSQAWWWFSLHLQQRSPPVYNHFCFTSQLQTSDTQYWQRSHQKWQVTETKGLCNGFLTACPLIVSISLLIWRFEFKNMSMKIHVPLLQTKELQEKSGKKTSSFSHTLAGLPYKKMPSTGFKRNGGRGNMHNV